ncbi:sel1 repeat family protein [Helicobacter pylori]|uniref:tetratricopeptide repeat protein n=1 Tax=Helicobacter pylori TaxID=210 RepID=UPI0013F46060|nr:tetratricopeptide repeat protein [Helicobacter pylori]NHB31780.1 sel1 repeat family protein [Helicobacter pylori]NHB41973.1 sel1 repeat family protein [Helicobacter pylori]
MLRGVKKAVFRVLCLGALCLGGLMAESNPKELIFLGITIYTDKDFTRAKEYFEKACGLHDADGCAILREAYSKVILKGSARESIEKALEHTATAKACKSNDAKKCKDLAEFYFNANDLKNALEYYSKACELNNGEGCSKLGGDYFLGESVTQDLKKAFGYYSKACELNDAKGCYALAAFYNEGKGVAKDEKQTTENLKKSCELGLKEACDILKEQKQ